MKKPTTGGPSNKDFHDSSLINFEMNPCLDQIELVISTPDEYSVQHTWLIRLSGILRFEYETTGIGYGEEFPIEVYDIYNHSGSDEVDYAPKKYEAHSSISFDPTDLHSSANKKALCTFIT